MPASPPLPANGRPALRSDGAEARARLVRAALRLFADQGFANTSTREIAEAAGTNLASISYYFGDKAGLYKAAFFEALDGEPPHEAQLPLDGLAPLAAFRVFFRVFLEPLKQGDIVEQCMRLHFREMLDPVGLWDEMLEREIRPQHQALCVLLSRELGVPSDSLDLQRLVFAIVGMAVHMFVGQSVINAIRPEVLDSPAAVDTTADRLAMYAAAMVEAERARLAALPARGAAP